MTYKVVSDGKVANQTGASDASNELLLRSLCKQIIHQSFYLCESKNLLRIN